MKRDHRDKTADMAVASVNKEWRDMARLALDIRHNKFRPEKEEQLLRLFIGIYKRLLTDPEEELIKEARR